MAQNQIQDSGKGGEGALNSACVGWVWGHSPRKKIGISDPFRQILRSLQYNYNYSVGSHCQGVVTSYPPSLFRFHLMHDICLCIPHAY